MSFGIKVLIMMEKEKYTKLHHLERATHII
jgi:hypothetical protein